jgi:4-oxalocrotonate tautomerase
MPHVIVKMYSGRSKEQKQALADALATAVMQVLGSAEESVSVAIEDVSAARWGEDVYEPDIVGRADTLFKKPGYGSLK